MRCLWRAMIPVLTVTVLSTAGPVAATSELVQPADQYTSAKAKRLAETHGPALTELSATLYHCLPWLEVQRHSIGFFRPKRATSDERYLSVRVFVEQEASAGFARLSAEERAAAMFSRYVGHLVRRMARSRALLEDGELAGFSVVIEWEKQGARMNGRPVHETIAVFLPRSVIEQYVKGRLDASGLARQARVLAFDGEQALGEMRLATWEDEFASTYQLKNYAQAAAIDCRVSR